jgi:hypothetical protein
MKFQTRLRGQCPKRAAPLVLFLLLLFGASAMAALDPIAELASFSVFNNVDLKDLTSDVKTAAGPPLNNPRFLSVQSCYVAPGTPEKQMEALRQWDPTKHRELKVFLHSDLPASASPADFSQLQKAPDNGAVRSFVSATQKMSSDLQISREEAKKFPEGAEDKGSGAMPGSVAKFWTEILSARVRSFVSGGAAAQPPYDHTSEAIRPGDELNGLLKQQEKIRRQFSGFLGQAGIGRGSGSLTPELYWELLEVDDQGVVTLGASYNHTGPFQAADVLYYASGGYYVALTLYQMWPVTVEGKPSTLVWRGDMISSASLASLHGVEKLASENAMRKDISKAITLFRHDASHR